MHLRKQLLIASLFTLSLPWVGCQYIQEMEDALLAGQNEALAATALAVSATLENDSKLVDELARLQPVAGASSIYVHKVASAFTLDGYIEEWLSLGLSPQTFAHRYKDDQNLSLYAGESDDKLWLFLRVNTGEINYHTPGSPIAQSDHIGLVLASAEAEPRHIAVVASSPGLAQIYELDQNANASPEHRFKAIWREWPDGYQVELSMPMQELGSGLQVLVNHGASAELIYSNVDQHHQRATIPPFISKSPQLTEALQIFDRDGISLKLASSGAAYVAGTGKLEASRNTQLPWLLSVIFQMALGDNDYPTLPEPEREGYFRSSDVVISLLGESQASRYRLAGQTISSISVPVYKNDKVVGVVVAEQNANSMKNFTDSALSRLFIWSLGVSLASAFMLVLYASWLSFRIGRLSRSAASAISDSGKVTEDFRASRLNDEVGDLSRSFAQLLSRLKEYTHYLKTLSSKLSHELRTPLAIVSSSLDNLEHETLSEQARVYALRAKEGSARLSNILNAMSAASRVEQAIGAAEFESIPLDTLLKNLRDAYTGAYPNVRFKLAVQEAKRGFTVSAAGELLVQMLDKLVDNAADFCPENGLIEFGLYRHQTAVVITVRNEGPALPQSMQRQLFDSMVSVRSQPTSEDQQHHLGLGLYIVRLIVDFHQGSVEAYNVPDNSGVIFEIRLPAPE